MPERTRIPGFRPASLLLVCLSLSIGWGIRGNYGHEFGAMMPGALAAIAACLFSGREDWRRRVVYFAFFGALGWGFGGSIAYMLPLSYTQSGHLSSQVYGFLMIFAEGFLWASLGGAGTAYPAVETRDRLTALFRPLCWVFAFWTLQYFGEDAFVAWYDRIVHGVSAATSDFRQKNPFYWLDSEWLEATMALLALCAFDLWERRGEKAVLLTCSTLAGAVGGFLLERLLSITGMLGPMLHMIIQYQGDLTAINPATGQPFEAANLLTNWPQVFFDAGHHLGWIFGAIAGAGYYFYRCGKWRSGASLLMHMTLGSYIVFLLGPVLLSTVFGRTGGFRMMPPRGDSWANIAGVYAGVLVYACRNGLVPVAWASVVSGFIGGLGLMLAQTVKVLAFSLGNPANTHDPAVVERWAHWRHANWHSLCTEQGAGLCYGLGIAVAMAMLATRLKPVHDDPPVRRWTEAFSVSFILNALLFVNMVKMLEDWTREQAGAFRSVPLVMKMPLFQNVELSAWAWFTLFFLLVTACTVALLVRHLKQPLAAVPAAWLGKGQLFYLLFLWAIVIGNFTKAVVAFHEQRIATEGLIILNALIATWILLAYARESQEVPLSPGVDFHRMIRRTLVGGMAALALGTFGFTAIIRGLYGNKPDGWGTPNIRFGAQADWRVKPILKNVQHR